MACSHESIVRRTGTDYPAWECDRCQMAFTQRVEVDKRQRHIAEVFDLVSELMLADDAPELTAAIRDLISWRQARVAAALPSVLPALTKALKEVKS